MFEMWWFKAASVFLKNSCRKYYFKLDTVEEGSNPLMLTVLEKWVQNKQKKKPIQVALNVEYDFQ